MGISRKRFSLNDKSKKITKLSPATSNHDQDWFLMATRPARGAGMDAGDWRMLPPGSRQRIINKMMDALRTYLHLSDEKLRRIAAMFEEKIYTAATSQSDYLRKISLKMLSTESKHQNDWRTQLRPDLRQRIVNKMLDALKRHPLTGQKGLDELKKIAGRFEEKIYTAATSQSDYLRKISEKMLSMGG